MSPVMDPIARFAEIAERYLAWVEGPRIELDPDLRRGYVLLLELIRAALDLPNRHTTDAEPTRISHDEWSVAFKSFAWIPVSYYWDAEPQIDGPQDLLVGDLHDDLADVWRDLKPALDLYRDEHVDAACWHWKFGFRFHWGEHAANALRVLTKLDFHQSM